MKQPVNEQDFRAAFQAMRSDNFSYEGLGALFEYFEELEEGLDEEFELDVIAICCDFAEYKDLEEFQVVQVIIMTKKTNPLMKLLH